MFVEHMDEQVQQQVQLEDELWRAMKNNEFVLYYQPVVDLNSGAIIGAEALLRWPNRHGDWISPSEFIPLTEQCGLIVPLSEWVFSEACTQLQMWRESRTRTGRPDDVGQPVAAPFRDSGAGDDDRRRGRTGRNRPEAPVYRDHREHADRQQRIGTRQLCGAQAHRHQVLAGRFRHRLFQPGIPAELHPIDLLKIDRTFVEGLPENADNAAIVTTIIALANSVNLSVVAKGVETAAQAAFLQQQGCHYAQGFLFGRPLPPDEFLSLVLERLGKNRRRVAVRYPPAIAAGPR